MSAKPVSRRPRRNRVYWARMIAEQAASGLSMEAFCKQRDLGWRTFVRWKGKLKGPQSTPEAFVELPGAVRSETPSPPVWDLELDLADGVRLRLRRA